MKPDLKTMMAALAQNERRFWIRIATFSWLLIACAMVALGGWGFISWRDENSMIAIVLSVATGVVCCFAIVQTRRESVRLIQVNEILINYEKARNGIEKAEDKGTFIALRDATNQAKAQSNNNPLIASLLASDELRLRQIIEIRYKKHLKQKLDDEHQAFAVSCTHRINALKNVHPLIKAATTLITSVEYLKERRIQIDAQWKAAYKEFSWWNAFYYGDTPDFKELDKTVTGLEVTLRHLLTTRGEDFEALHTHYNQLSKRAVDRVLETKIKSDEFVRQSRSEDILGKDLLKRGLWLGAMSIPVSLWDDVSRAGDVYDALRSVHGGFHGMSDDDIWWECLLLPSDSLAGLASLTKGAYFEQLVAADTSGELFEHFNHADTDIVIDGIEFQLKATDSASYINSVADGIPVISTSEVAEITGAIDSGYDNESLSLSVDLALGGSVVDFGDTTADAILSGIGGLGVFASLQGINHAVKKHENGGDAVEACFEGAGIAIEGTARAAVNTLELGYNVLSSRPSRFVGRLLLKGFIKLDDKMMSTTSENKKT